MQAAAQVTPPKVVHTIPAKIDLQEEVKNARKQLRVAAYCRVSTKQEDQLNSYDVQRRAYTDKINGEHGWTMVGIYADKGITGTSVKKRDEFNRLMRHCKQGKVDMIITKSVARFARNTLDCLKHTRLLKEHNVDVYFEEQGIHSIQPGAEFYITIYGSIAQSESENISANVRWGKAQSAKEGNVPFQYKRFLGYRRGSDGKPEIDPEQAVVVKRIYERFLAGDSLAMIANDLNADEIPTPSGIGQWQRGTIASILTNEKYKGDAILNKTYIRDCLSKKVVINNGERPKYYVENNHPAIIDSATFGRVQEEMARRNGKRKVKQVGTKTEQGRYSSKYALTELLICGECGTPYRRCTWAANGKKKIVWRCISRRIDEQQNAVDHLEDTLDLAAEIGVARGIDDVDFRSLIMHGGILGQNGNAALTLQIARVHHAVHHGLVLAVDAALLEHLIDQRRLAMVNVRDDGDISNVFLIRHGR